MVLSPDWIKFGLILLNELHFLSHFIDSPVIFHIEVSQKYCVCLSVIQVPAFIILASPKGGVSIFCKFAVLVVDDKAPVVRGSSWLGQKETVSRLVCLFHVILDKIREVLQVHVDMADKRQVVANPECDVVENLGSAWRYF